MSSRRWRRVITQCVVSPSHGSSIEILLIIEQVDRIVPGSTVKGIIWRCLTFCICSNSLRRDLFEPVRSFCNVPIYITL
jgi:hypothetical protein